MVADLALITAAQLRAARALLGMDQRALAHAARLSPLREAAGKRGRVPARSRPAGSARSAIIISGGRST